MWRTSATVRPAQLERCQLLAQSVSSARGTSRSAIRRIADCRPRASGYRPMADLIRRGRERALLTLSGICRSPSVTASCNAGHPPTHSSNRHPASRQATSAVRVCGPSAHSHCRWCPLSSPDHEHRPSGRAAYRGHSCRQSHRSSSLSVSGISATVSSLLPRRTTIWMECC